MENRDLQGSWGGATVRQDYAMMMMMIFEKSFLIAAGVLVD